MTFKLPNISPLSKNKIIPFANSVTGLDSYFNNPTFNSQRKQLYHGDATDQGKYGGFDQQKVVSYGLDFVSNDSSTEAGVIVDDGETTSQAAIDAKLLANSAEYEKMSGRARKLKLKMGKYGKETAQYSRIKGKFDKEMKREVLRNKKVSDRVNQNVTNVGNRVNERTKSYNEGDFIGSMINKTDWK